MVQHLQEVPTSFRTTSNVILGNGEQEKNRKAICTLYEKKNNKRQEPFKGKKEV